MEYPVAKELGKTVLPVEMSATNHQILSERFRNIPKCINSNDESTLNESILAAFSEYALRKNDQDPVHNYLIGLAYLEVNAKSSYVR